MCRIQFVIDYWLVTDVHTDKNHSIEEAGELPWDEEAVLPPLSPDTDCDMAVYGPELQPLADAAILDAVSIISPPSFLKGVIVMLKDLETINTNDFERSAVDRKHSTS